jgi:hypothetical protein
MSVTAPEEKKAEASDPLVRRALAVVAWLRDPAFPGLVMMATIAIAGAVSIYFGWRAVARTIYVPLQLPALVSGGIGGLALIGLGLFLFDLQMSRRDLARERKHNADLLDEIASLVTLAPKLRQRSETGD